MASIRKPGVKLENRTYALWLGCEPEPYHVCLIWQEARRLADHFGDCPAYVEAYDENGATEFYVNRRGETSKNPIPW